MLLVSLLCVAVINTYCFLNTSLFTFYTHFVYTMICMATVEAQIYYPRHTSIDTVNLWA